MIVTDQNNFIILNQIIADTPDAAFAIDIAKQLKNQFGNRIASLSFDKGFSSKEIIEDLESIIPNAIIKQKGKPKPGAGGKGIPKLGAGPKTGNQVLKLSTNTTYNSVKECRLNNNIGITKMFKLLKDEESDYKYVNKNYYKNN